MGRSIFDSAEYIDAFGIEDVVSVAAPGPEGGEGEPLLFQRHADHAVLLARATRLDAATIRHAAEALFASSKLRYVVFGDIPIDEPVRWRPPPLCFRHQNDWVVRLDGDGSAVPASIRRETDRKLRVLTRENGGLRLVHQPCPSRDIVETIMEFNRRKTEGAGRVFLIDASRRERILRLLARRGEAMLLYRGDTLIAGDVFAVHGKGAYLFVRGYDQDYARTSPGLITLRHAIEGFATRGFVEAHLMWGDNPYKRRFGAERTALTTILVLRDRRAWMSITLPRQAGVLAWLVVKRRLRDHPRLVGPLMRARARLRRTLGAGG